MNLKREQKKVSNLKNIKKMIEEIEQHLRDMSDNIKWSKFYITGIQNGERMGKKNILKEKMAKKFTNLVKQNKKQIQGAQQS